MQKIPLPAIAFAVLGLAGSEAARAAVATFDFEGATATTNGGLTTLTQSDSGLSVTITRPGSVFDVRDTTTASFPASFGTRTLNPFANDESNTAFILNFSAAISGLSVQVGDFFADDDSISVSLFTGANGAGALLNATSTPYPGGFPNDVASLSVNGTGALSAVLIGGSTNFPNSVYYDNITVTFGGTTPVPVPEPASFALFTLGLLGLAATRRRASD